MPDPKPTAWRCGSCGYIHRGPEPPEWCPVCGAARSEFEPYAEPASVAPAPSPRHSRCMNCGHVHEGAEPPGACPVCGAQADRFEPLAEAAEKAAGGREAGHVVVVGAGIAGLSAVEAVRAASPSARITLVSKEPGLPYYRLNLTRFLAGELQEQDLPVHPASWFEERRIDLLAGTEVAAISPAEHTVALRGAGDALAFDKLIVTAGAHPFMPPFAGAHREGVTPVRTLADARYVLDAVAGGAKVVCIGGGILGLEAAAGLARRGADVTLLEGHGWLMPRQLNPRAGEIIESHALRLGVKVRKKARTAEILGDERAREVLLEDGERLEAGLVLITTGVRPNSYLARLAGLEVNQGIIVDDHLAASHPGVLAAGDVAEHRGTLYGLWAPAQYQGQIAGMNAAGLAAEFGGIPRSNTLKVLGIDLFSIGQFEPSDASFAVVEQESDGRYLRFVFRDSFLLGAILLGESGATTPVKTAIEGRRDFSDLLARKPKAADILAELTGRG